MFAVSRIDLEILLCMACVLTLDKGKTDANWIHMQQTDIYLVANVAICGDVLFCDEFQCEARPPSLCNCEIAVCRWCDASMLGLMMYCDQ